MRKKGFTLIELLIVIAVIAVLFVVILSKVNFASDRAKDSGVLTDFRSYQIGIEQTLRECNVTDTTSISDFNDMLNKNLDKKMRFEVTGTEYQSIVKNPYGYHYVMTKTGTDIKVYSIDNQGGASILGYNNEVYAAGEYSTGKVLIADVENRQYDIEKFGDDISVAYQENGEAPPVVVVHEKPIASISMTPETDLKETTVITWSSSSSTCEAGATIVAEEWTGKQLSYTAGDYTVSLKVLDSNGNWSDIVTKTFTVTRVATVIDIATGPNNTFLLMSDGTVKGAGDNAYGQLGRTASLGGQQASFETIPGLSNVKSIAGGQSFFAVLNDGTVKGLGYNRYGQLGVSQNSGTTNQNPDPIDLGLSDVKQVASGGNTTLVLKNDGTVIGFGTNYYGQLGKAINVGTYTIMTPAQIPGVSGVKAIASGSNNSYFVLNDGNVKACGYNKDGQLGSSQNIGTTNGVTSVVASGFSNVAKLAAGGNHVAVLTNDGKVYTAGNNQYGQLGSPTNSGTNNSNYTPILAVNNATDISVGINHTLVLKLGRALVFGSNQYGQIGLDYNVGTTTALNTPVYTSLTGVSKVSANTFLSAVLNNDGTLTFFGRNNKYQFGVNNGLDINSTPVNVSIN